MNKKITGLIYISLGIILISSLNFLPKLFYSNKKLKIDLLVNHINIPQKNNIQWMKATLLKAKADKVQISFIGSGHSQGGHNYVNEGIVLNLSNLDKIERITDQIIRVQAGANWKKVIEFLNPLGLSVSIMQSDYDFTLGGTVSTNVHGWQANSKPMISSIEGFNLLTADGNLLYCSRDENYDLFKAVIGGYGLLGIIVDVDLKTVPNRSYISKQLVIKSSDFINSFTSTVKNNSEAKLFFARFSLHQSSFLQEVIIRVYEEYDNLHNSNSLKTFRYGEKVINRLFALTDNNSFLKRIRWKIETNKWISEKFKVLSRNQLLYHSTKLYNTDDLNKIDLLQEYFVPLKHFNKFTDFLRSMESEISPHLMNLTIRHVQEDDESILNYAKHEMICFVMFFRGSRTNEFNIALKHIAIKITDKALDLQGSYYLPYKPFQTREQFHRAYPKSRQFQHVKELFDPNKLFQNSFYQNYLSDG
ncbi:MAG: FAD-binding oxidoreductase [Rickettsiaceae bacterium]|nr:MAG: FAD-binding oxidoreductase [Rickettsiaceae bacterium]